MFFKNDPTKTPLENANSRIKAAYIAAFISAAMTLLLIILSSLGQSVIQGFDFYVLIDVVFIVVLAFLIKILRSRIAAVIMFVYFLISKVIIFMDNPGAMSSFSVIIAIIFAVAFWYGILGTFAYQKIRKEEKAGNDD